MTSKSQKIIIFVVAIVIGSFVLKVFFNSTETNKLVISTDNQQPNKQTEVPIDNTEQNKEKERKEKEEKERIEKEKREALFKKPEKSPIKQPKENKKFTIGVLPIYGTKIQQFPKHEHIKFEALQLNYREDYPYWPSKGFFISLFGFKYRTDSEEKAKYQEYQEDIVISYVLHEYGKRGEFHKYDYLFVPPIGITFTDQIVNELYDFINAAIQDTPNHCYLQSFIPLTERKKYELTNQKYLFNVDWPEKSFRTISGMFISPDNLKKVINTMKSINYLNRFDMIMQHYCEVIDSPILVAPYNIYEPLDKNTYN